MASSLGLWRGQRSQSGSASSAARTWPVSCRPSVRSALAGSVRRRGPQRQTMAASTGNRNRRLKPQVAITPEWTPLTGIVILESVSAPWNTVWRPRKRFPSPTSRLTSCSATSRPRNRCSAITTSRVAHDAQSGAGGSRTATTSHDHHRPAVIKPIRWADYRKITPRPARHAMSPDRRRVHRNPGDVNVYGRP